jgi:phosphopantothenoylcysteine synthetase/decarboxylase
VPPADAIIVAPATYNTINKLASGVADNYALGLLAECIGLGVPVVVLPFINSALAGRAPLQAAVAALRSEGIRILLGPGEFEPHPSGQGEARIAGFPWKRALNEAAARAAQPGTAT